MLFSSFAFIAGFMPIAFAGFALCARFGHRFAVGWLVLASLAFYAFWRLDFLPLLLTSITFNFCMGRLIVRLAPRARLQSVALFGGIAANLMALFYFKYAAALAAWLGFNAVLGTPLTDIILPLGISFFTFTQIGYLVDVKQGATKAADPLSYALFVTFFPHLIAGPILHNREMMPQFEDPAGFRIDGRNICIGLTIFSIGLAKKVLFADPLADDVAANFAQAETLSMMRAWHGVIGYSLQLYFDFSGYSDMAIGLARLFNVRFPLNFNSPYRSTTVIDYWQRFHMTLTRFITMYIFSPLALWITHWRAARGLENSRRASATPGGFAVLVVIPTIVTMALAGVWHGAGLQYLVFGLLHGLYITVNHACRVFFPKPRNQPARSWSARQISHWWRVLAVYVAALVAFAFFRASSCTAAMQILAGMIGLHGIGIRPPFATIAEIVLLFVIVWGAPNTQQIMTRFEPALGRAIANPHALLTWQPGVGWGLACGTVAVLGLLALGRSTEFLYFQF